jgi:hypothetical protein
VPWKVFQEKSLSAEGYLLCFKAALSLDSKWSANFHDKLVCLAFVRRSKLWCPKATQGFASYQGGN